MPNPSHLSVLSNSLRLLTGILICSSSTGFVVQNNQNIKAKHSSVVVPCSQQMQDTGGLCSVQSPVMARTFGGSRGLGFTKLSGSEGDNDIHDDEPIKRIITNTETFSTSSMSSSTTTRRSFSTSRSDGNVEIQMGEIIETKSIDSVSSPEDEAFKQKAEEEAGTTIHFLEVVNLNSSEVVQAPKAKAEVGGAAIKALEVVNLNSSEAVR